MANSCHNDNNWCSNCTRQSFNGIIRNSRFYCSESCSDRAHKKVHFGGVDHRYISSGSSHTPSGINSRISPRISPRIEKQCNYCFDTFDMAHNRGIEYGPMWFCCQYHLNLANPRPKVMTAPIGGHMVIGQPMIVPPMIGPPMIGAPFIGPQIIGRHVIGPFIGHPF